MKLSEKDLQNYGTQLLEMDGWRAFRTEMTVQREYGRVVGEVGMPDYQYIRYEHPDIESAQRLFPNMTRIQLLAEADVLFIEWKRKGGKAAAHQLAWHEQERKRGALTLIAGEDFEATPEGFMAFYRASGLMRKKIT